MFTAKAEVQVFERRKWGKAAQYLRGFVSMMFVVLVASCAGSIPDDGNDESSGGVNGRVSCDPRAILCRRAPPTCSEGEVPSVLGRCYGPCVPIEECSCTGPEACPFPDTYTCFLDRKHCGPYLF